MPAEHYAAAVAATQTLSRQFSGKTSFDPKELRLAGAAMLGIAAVRPLVPFEFVPPCPLKTVTGIPCPMCGMTRGVTSLVHGDFAHALLMNPASYLAVALAILLIVRWRRSGKVEIPVWLVIAVLVVDVVLAALQVHDRPPHLNETVPPLDHDLFDHPTRPTTDPRES